MSETPVGVARSALAEYFSEKAEFRSWHAENQEAWGGNKNEAYADSLSAVADFVLALPDDDPTLRKLAACPVLFCEGVFSVPAVNEHEASATDNKAIHCGPRGDVIAPDQCAEWFQGWAETALQEAAERTCKKCGEWQEYCQC